MQAVRVAMFNVVFYVVTFLWAMVIAAATYVSGQRRIRAMIASWCRWTQWWVRVGLGAKIEKLGRENVPDGPYVIAPKHQSELDVAVIFGEHSNCGAVVMKELSDLPFLGALIRKLDLVPVSVNGGPQGLTETIRAGAVRVAAQGRPILIYPEGELMALGARERYKSGAFQIYEAAGIPVVPIAQSLGAIWPQRKWNKKPGRTGAIRYLPPIQPGLGKEEFMAKLEDMIESESMALIRQHAGPEELAAAESRYARKARNE